MIGLGGVGGVEEVWDGGMRGWGVQERCGGDMGCKGGQRR